MCVHVVAARIACLTMTYLVKKKKIQSTQQVSPHAYNYQREGFTYYAFKIYKMSKISDRKFLERVQCK